MRWIRLRRKIPRSAALGTLLSFLAVAVAAQPLGGNPKAGPELDTTLSNPEVATPSDARQSLAIQEPASAEEPQDLSYSRNGGYVGIGGTFAIENFKASAGDHDDAGSVMFRAGYRGLPWVAVEFLGEVLPRFSGTDDDNDVNGFAVTINAKAILPLGRCEPYAMIGLGLLDIDADIERRREDDFVFRSAAGLDLYVTPHWVLYAEASYMLPTGEVKKYPYATVGGGILFRF